jgi:hypothetical protein
MLNLVISPQNVFVLALQKHLYENECLYLIIRLKIRCKIFSKNISVLDQ